MQKSVHTIYFVVFVITCVTACSSLGQSVSEGSGITAVSGESWLTHLHRTFDETSMGKTGRLGPPELMGTPEKTTELPDAGNSETRLLSGSDLYRLNCRGCHGEFGTGAPPEINSVISPVRASSAVLVMERMKNAGATLSRADASKLADQSKAMLLQRFHNGGEDMPAFPQLSEADIRVLLGYLKQLAEVPGAERERGTVKASGLRVGELIVKSTCHTCHSATGLDPTPKELSDGAIPPLSALTTRVNRAEFVRKVTQGAPIIMGNPALPYRGRMPVFFYLSEAEASDVFSYLQTYPPKAAENTSAAMASLQEGNDAGNDPPVTSPLPPNKAEIPASNLETDDPIVLGVAGLLVMFLLAGGAALSVWELRRLAPPKPRQLARNYPPTPLPRIQRDMVA